MHLICPLCASYFLFIKVGIRTTPTSWSRLNEENSVWRISYICVRFCYCFHCNFLYTFYTILYMFHLFLQDKYIELRQRAWRTTPVRGGKTRTQLPSRSSTHVDSISGFFHGFPRGVALSWPISVSRAPQGTPGEQSRSFPSVLCLRRTTRSGSHPM